LSAACATLASCMRICIVYDCLFPHTVGGAERWYRNLSEKLAAEGHDVTYLTLRQWDRGADPGVVGVRVVEAGPRLSLYTESGRRKIGPPLVFGVGVLWHLLRHGRDYDAVHTASFPYFSLLAAAATQRIGRFRLVVDWFEAWTREYWTEYLGRWGGLVGWLVQRACLRVPQRAFCFSRLHARRLRDEGFRGDVTVLEGMYTGSLQARREPRRGDTAVFAGRFIPEKRVEALVGAVQAARRELPDLRAEIYGDGPERGRVRLAVELAGMEDVIGLPGFVESKTVQDAIAHASCMVLPSRREGYGMVVIEAASYGTPSVVVADADNAAVEHIDEGVNGYIAASAGAEDLAAAIVSASRGGAALRRSTADWFEANARRLSLDHSLTVVVEAYAAV
jgi:glycosyltransferase involved in cell wall biosynthesis